MSQVAKGVAPSITSPDFVPALHSGDRLSRSEFERRYKAAKGIRAELIEGVVYVSSPVSFAGHGVPHSAIGMACSVFVAMTPGLATADNSTVRLDADNEPQPDILLMRSKAGSAKVDEDDYVDGSPEWIAEVAASSASYDLHEKFRAYRRNGVKEYVVLRTLEGAMDYFVLTNGEFVRAVADEAGVYKSRVFPGLWLNEEALLTGDLAVVLQTVQAGIASPEHAAFAASLTAAP